MRALTLALALAACGHGAPPASPPPVTQTGSGNASAETECDAKECGPKMGMPQKQCHDGSMGGPTGRCLKNDAGACSWEVKACPE